MSVFFQRIGGGKYDFIEDQEVRNRIDEAGRKSVIFVEGPTDERIFEIFFGDSYGALQSYVPTGGHAKVKEYLQKFISTGIEGFGGIVDRDFMSDEERVRVMNEYLNLLYIHK